MMNLVKKLVREEEGQGMAEYALILAVVAVIALVGFKTLGGKVNNKINAVGTELN